MFFATVPEMSWIKFQRGASRIKAKPLCFKKN